jgi:hypothetical protein
VEAVAAGDEVALELVRRAVVPERDPRPLRLDPVERDAVDLEQERRARGEARLDQVLDDLRLAVDDDRLAVRQVAERDAVPLAVELELDPVVDDPLALQAIADARGDEEIGGALLEDARTDPRLDVLAASVLENDALDALALEEPREGQPGGAGPDDADLRAQPVRQPAPSSSSTRRAIANAEFAAGTPQ